MKNLDAPTSSSSGISWRMLVACGPVAAFVAVGIILMWLGSAQEVVFVYRGF